MGILTKAVSILARGLNLNSPVLYSFMTGGPTASGETVTVSTAMRLDTVWACVRLISQTVATLPLQLYVMDAQGRGVIAREHPLYSILHDQPNADMTSVNFLEAMIASILLEGNAYASIDRGPTGNVIALTPLQADHLTVQRQGDGSLIYRYNWNGQYGDMTEDQIFHVKGFSLNGLVGISPIAQARETLGIALAAERTAGALFKNGMRPSAVMSAPTFLNKEQRETFGADFVTKFTGAINAGRTPLLEGGFKFENLSIKPQDAELLATRQFSIEQICRWFGVASVMIGHMDKSTAWGTGLEQMNLWFLTYTLRPLLKAVEQEIRRTLLKPAERATYYAEFNVEGLLRADSKGRAELMKALVVNGLATPNELRALDNREPLEGGDDLLVLNNMIPLRIAGEFGRRSSTTPIDTNYKPTAVSPADSQGSENAPA